MSNGKKGVNKSSSNSNLLILIAYIGEFITGAIVYILYGDKDKRVKFHAEQAFFLGLLTILVSIIFDVLMFISPFFYSIGSILEILIWLYGLYIGYEGYLGKDIRVPILSDYIKD